MQGCCALHADKGGVSPVMLSSCVGVAYMLVGAAVCCTGPPS